MHSLDFPSPNSRSAPEGTGQDGGIFKLHSDFTPQGDQPAAIEALIHGLQRGDRHQALLGVTGSGKTFVAAKVIEQLNLE